MPWLPTFSVAGMKCTWQASARVPSCCPSPTRCFMQFRSPSIPISSATLCSAVMGSAPEVFRPPASAERAALRQKFGWPHDRPVAAFVGALGDLRKGFDTLFEAWRTLCAESSWDGHLAVVGAGAELPLWRQRAAGAGIASRIEFLGFRTDVPDLMRAIDVHVSPTRYEPYSLVTQEAICC